MNASDNPFFILKVSTRERKSRLIELAEEAALHGDHEAAVISRNVLSNPRTRLAAEMAWFPGLSPKRVGETLDVIGQGNYPNLKGMNPLCRANFAAEALKIYADGAPPKLQEGVERLSNHVEEIDPKAVMLAINEDRQVAGIPPISDLALVETEISERVRHFERTVRAYLEDLPSKEMVDTYEGLVSCSTNDGEDAGQRLINALVDSYELKAGGFLAGEAERIKKLIDNSKAATDRNVSEKEVRASVNEIIAALRIWDSVAQPIQLAYKSRGLDHDESQSLATKTRNFSLYLFNQHDYLDDAKLLSTALQELFSEVVAVSDQIQDDIGALDNIAVQRAERQRHEAHSKAEFAREITYETTFGTIFKDKFRISPEGFDYKGTLIPLEKIFGVRWGATRNSVNGIPTGTDYFFGYGSPHQSFGLQPNERQYKEIIQRAWRAACVPILLRWMEDWSKGQDVKIGGVAVSDTGLMLRRGRFLKEDESKFFPWGDLKKGSHNGCLNFYGKSDSRFTLSFSFKDVWNIHILDFAMDKIWEGKSRLSRIFED
jgi:hypothetical protein